MGRSAPERGAPAAGSSSCSISLSDAPSFRWEGATFEASGLIGEQAPVGLDGKRGRGESHGPGPFLPSPGSGPPLGVPERAWANCPRGGMPMRVLQVVGSAEGGLRRHLVQLLRGLAGHRFVVAGPPAVLAGLDALPAVEALWPLPGGGGSWAPAGHGREPWADPGDGQSPP